MNEINKRELDNYITKEPDYPDLEDMSKEELIEMIEDLNEQIDSLKKSNLDKIKEPENQTKIVYTSCENSCISNVSVNQCLKGHKSCCNLLYISNDYEPR
jgi:hypothetical protein